MAAVAHPVVAALVCRGEMSAAGSRSNEKAKNGAAAIVFRNIFFELVMVLLFFRISTATSFKRHFSRNAYDLKKKYFLGQNGTLI